MSIQSRSATRQLHRPLVRRIHAGWIIFIAAFLLMLLGVEAIDTTRPATANRQFMLGGFGMVCAILVAFIPQKRFRQASWRLYVFGLFLLLILFV